MQKLKQQGFTLIEMIIVITISGILLSVVSVFIARPIQGFIDLSRRATLVYSAENALRRMQRDVRRALPNSIRVAGNALELISTVEGARYRLQGGTDADNRLEFESIDTDFDILGNFNNLPAPFPALPFSSTSHRIAIYNIGDTTMGVPTAGSNAYAGPDASGRNVITPAGRTITFTDDPVGDEDHINIDNGGGIGWRFSHPSPSKRLYIVNGAISYVCSGGQLRRYTYNNFSNDTQPSTDAALVALGGDITNNLMADNVTACTFTYSSGTHQRSGVTTLDLTISDVATGERIRLLQQVHVDNAP